MMHQEHQQSKYSHRILNSKEKKAILAMIEEQWGCDLKLEEGMLQNNEGKIFLITPEIANIDISKLRINSLGLYIAELKDNNLRLSIEGSEVVGPHAKKNVVNITRDELNAWLLGDDLFKECDAKGFIILRYNGAYVGCGRYGSGKITNFIGKNRRISAAHE